MDRERKEDPLKNWKRPPREECPLCLLPLPINSEESQFYSCCGNVICNGCIVSQIMAHIDDEEKGGKLCPFCREALPKRCGYDAVILEREMALANSGRGEAMYYIGEYYMNGEKGLEQDIAEGLKWLHRALEAGFGRAAVSIGKSYDHGDGVDQDGDKALEYYHKGADLNHIYALIMIGQTLVLRGELEEAMLYWRKAMMCGDKDDTLAANLRKGYSEGYITKDEYAFTLREHQTALNEMKSEARETFLEYMARRG